jgi:branched-subunit amino acid transport protein
MGIITFLLRLALIISTEHFTMPERLQQGLQYVPAAVLSAIIFPELLMPGGTLDLSIGNARLLAGVLAIVVAWRTKNVLLTIAVGMVALWILQALMAGI